MFGNTHQMSRIRTIVEVTYEDEDGEDKMGNYYLLHWGIRFDLLPDSYGNLVPVHFTVAICQNLKSGVIEMFTPDQIRVLGVNIKEE
jgi:hypothetical protein